MSKIETKMNDKFLGKNQNYQKRLDKVKANITILTDEIEITKRKLYEENQNHQEQLKKAEAKYEELKRAYIELEEKFNQRIESIEQRPYLPPYPIPSEEDPNKNKEESMR